MSLNPPEKPESWIRRNGSGLLLYGGVLLAVIWVALLIVVLNNHGAPAKTPFTDSNRNIVIPPVSMDDSLTDDPQNGYEEDQ